MPAPNPDLLTFDAAKHQYRYAGRKLTSVTTLVKEYTPPFAAYYWAKRKAAERGCFPEDILREWDEKRDASARKGTAVHEFGEDLAMSSLIPWVSREVPAMVADGYEKPIRSLFDTGIIRPRACERRICSPRYLVAGTIDLDADVHGIRCILDYKTNESIDDGNRYGERMLPPLELFDSCNFVQYSLQLSIYQFILEEEYGEKFFGRYLVHLPGDGTYKIWPASDMREWARVVCKENRDRLVQFAEVESGADDGS